MSDENKRMAAFVKKLAARGTASPSDPEGDERERQNRLAANSSVAIPHLVKCVCGYAETAKQKAQQFSRSVIETDGASVTVTLGRNRFNVRSRGGMEQEPTVIVTYSQLSAGDFEPTWSLTHKESFRLVDVIDSVSRWADDHYGDERDDSDIAEYLLESLRPV